MGVYPERMTVVSGASCRSCGSSNLDWVTKGMALLTPIPYPLSGDLSIVNCRQCGFIGSHSPSIEADYVSYYTHYNKHHSRLGLLQKIDQEYFSGILDLIGTDLQIDWAKTNVLDFGSGALQFSEMAKTRGALGAYNYDMEHPYPDVDYGLVVSTHCFEHIYNFNSELARINHILVDGGAVCVAVPDVRGYIECYYGPYNCFDLEHINHFDCASLEAALQRNGFETVSVRESERLVAPTLAYPEVLILARKGTSMRSVAVESRRPDTKAVLAEYLNRSAIDLEAALQRICQAIQAYERSGVNFHCGFYGLSSSAFRILTHASDAGFPPLGWMADSDKRLSGKTILDIPIFDVDEFAAMVLADAAAGRRTVAFVCAVNAARIATFLDERFGETLDVIVLPPDCQNRDR